MSLGQAQARIEALLSAGVASVAATYIEAERNLDIETEAGWHKLQRLHAHLRLALLSSEWAAIDNTVVPDGLNHQETESARQLLEFFKATATLHRPGGDFGGAAEVFLRLQKRHPEVTAYWMNLFAARISLLLSGDMFARLSDPQVVEAKRTLAEAEQAKRRSGSLTKVDLERYGCNRAALLLAIGDPEGALDALAGLHAEHLQEHETVFKAIALSRLGQVAEAQDLLAQGRLNFEDPPLLRGAWEHIRSGKGYQAPAYMSEGDEVGPKIQSALGLLGLLNPHDQAAMFNRTAEPFDNYAIDQMRGASSGLIGLSPMMRKAGLDLHEDDITAVLAALLNGRLHVLGWAFGDQSRGGYTANGNPGERDLVLFRDNTTLAIFEAVVCRKPVSHEWMRLDLTSHFQKLFGYGTCKLFFHVTYCYNNDLAGVIAELKKDARSEVPNGYSFLRHDDIQQNDSRPAGFIARYTAENGEIKVVFLVLNMGQDLQRGAAKLAAENNPRNRNAAPRNANKKRPTKNKNPQ